MIGLPREAPEHKI